MSIVSPDLAKLNARPIILGELTEATAIAIRLGFAFARAESLAVLECAKHHSTRSPGWMGPPDVFRSVHIPPILTVKYSSTLGPAKEGGCCIESAQDAGSGARFRKRLSAHRFHHPGCERSCYEQRRQRRSSSRRPWEGMRHKQQQAQQSPLPRIA